jgi:hypothetical protein
MTARAFMLVFAGVWTVPTIPTCVNVYRSDVERMCDAERGSGKTVRADAAGVMRWLQHNIASAQGIVLEGQLESESPRDRAVHLRTEARNQSIAACPLADAFDAYAVDDDYRTAVQSLCDGSAVTAGGGIARLDVTPADDAERMREIRDWTITNLKGADALALVDKLAQSPVQGRPALLRSEASRLGINNCPLAATLERPPPTPIPVTFVSLPAFSVLRSDGPQKVQEALAGTLISGAAVQTIDNCYGQALVKAPTLTGNVSVRLSFDPKGKVTKAEEASSSLASPPVVKCITSGLVGAQLIPPGPAAKYTATLALAPVRGAPTPGWPSLMPTGLSPSSSSPSDPGPPDAGAPAAGSPDAGVGKKRRGGR